MLVSQSKALWWCDIDSPAVLIPWAHFPLYLHLFVEPMSKLPDLNHVIHFVEMPADGKTGEDISTNTKDGSKRNSDTAALGALPISNPPMAWYR